MVLAVDAGKDALRNKTLDAAKRHKASWIELGQYLYAIYKDKYYKDWGYLTFEAYCGKEINVKLSTASKLLKSYDFLEKEEPLHRSESAWRLFDVAAWSAVRMLVVRWLVLSARVAHRLRRLFR